jgi:single-strand DNA-binding protein
MALNQVTLVGRLTADPELTFLQDGTAVTRFTLAVARDYKDNNNERPADFIRCVIWGNTEQKNRATTFADFNNKGDLIDVTGRIETRSFQGDDGNNVYITEVNVRDFHFISQPQGTDQQQEQQAPPARNNNRGNTRNTRNNTRR